MECELTFVFVKKSLVEMERENPSKQKKDSVQSEHERQEKIRKYLEEEEHRQSYVEKDERKRGYNSLSADSYAVTEEEMEAYMLKKKRFDDPMRNFVSNPGK